MDRDVFKELIAFTVILFCALPLAFGADLELAKDSKASFGSVWSPVICPLK
jgi:hypothetical protein